jgi:NTE family protein
MRIILNTELKNRQFLRLLMNLHSKNADSGRESRTSRSLSLANLADLHNPSWLTNLRNRLIHRLKIAMVTAALALAGCAQVPVLTPPQTGPAAGVPIEPTPSSQITKRPPKIGLALGGGAARGFAHVGVIQVLEEAGIRPSFVTGTSAGSLVAAIYASGKTGAQLQQVAETMDEAAITDWTLPIFSRGVLRGEALARYVNTQVGGQLIESFALPLGIVATDLHSGQSILFRRGDTGVAVRASSAVPAVFQPVAIGDREYVDGGLVSPVPVRYAKQMGAELVIAVDISAAPEANAAQGTLQILLQTFAIMGKSINSFELKEADLVVRPALNAAGSADFSGRKKSIEAGRVAMQQMLPQLRLKMLELAKLP